MTTGNQNSKFPKGGNLREYMNLKNIFWYREDGTL